MTTHIMRAAFLNILFPPRCVVCGAGVDAVHSVCASCFAALHVVSAPYCATCGIPFVAQIEGITQCGVCMMEPMQAKRAYAVLRYDDASRPLITRMKYADRHDLAQYGGRMLFVHGAPLWEQADLLIPVPLSRWRHVRRGYNQSELLAQVLAGLSGKKTVGHYLRRVRHTPPQAGLSRTARARNVAGAFAVPTRYLSAVKDLRICVIDDVLTTGATANDATRALLDAGAAEVTILALARRVL